LAASTIILKIERIRGVGWGEGEERSSSGDGLLDEGRRNPAKRSRRGAQPPYEDRVLGRAIHMRKKTEVI